MAALLSWELHGGTRTRQLVFQGSGWQKPAEVLGPRNSTFPTSQGNLDMGLSESVSTMATRCATNQGFADFKR